MPALSQAGEVVRRELPKINGSSGAFVAVVVVLAVIIVVSCSAVVYLILESRRANGYPRQRYQTTVATSRSLEQSTDPPPSSGRLRSAVDRFLSRDQKASPASVESHPKPSRRSGQGWVQAAGNDYDESTEDGTRPRGHAPQMSEVLENTHRPASGAASASASPKAPLRALDPRERVSSMLSDTSMSMDSTFRDGTALRYPEPYAPSPQRSISNMTALLPHSMMSSPASSPPPSVNRLATSSPERMSGDDADETPGALKVYPSGQGRALTSTSAVSMRTVDTGSRFIEGL